MAAPRVAKLSGTVSWSDGELFNGYVVIGTVLPSSGSVAWTQVTVEPNAPKMRLPLWTTVPISDGVYHSQVGLWYTADMDPPNTKYCSYWYDTALRQIAAPASSADFFTVTADPTTLTIPTLTAPTAGTTVPVPI